MSRKPTKYQADQSVCLVHGWSVMNRASLNRRAGQMSRAENPSTSYERNDFNDKGSDDPAG